MMKSRFSLLIAGAVSCALTACCCFEPEPILPTTLPIVREATIAEFNSAYLGTAPSPEFNIATYSFPLHDQSSGSLPNDERFSKGVWEFTEYHYQLRGLKTNYRFLAPPNSMIAGDFVVDSIDLVSGTAFVRMKGKMHRLPQLPALHTDDAHVFASEIERFIDTSFVPSGSSVCSFLDAQAVKYGTTTPMVAGSSYQITVTDLNNAPTAYSFPANWPTDSHGQPLPPVKWSKSADIEYYQVALREGDWFYYKAENSMSFFVLVTSIGQGTLPPYIRRLTFKFSESYGCYDCTK